MSPAFLAVRSERLDFRVLDVATYNISQSDDIRSQEFVETIIFPVASIEPFEGGRWRLRRMRASGCTDLTAMGIESFFVCSLLILLGLGKSEKTENRS
jgi:hypothetical protein